VTRLRKMMLDELQRRNYSQSTVRSYVYAVEDFSKYFHRSRTASVQSISASTRHTCFVIASSRRGQSKAVLQLCGFSSSKHSGVRISPITFRFRSARGGCRQC